MSSHNVVFAVECQVMIDKSEGKREISLNLHFLLFVTGEVHVNSSYSWFCG